MSRCWGSSRVMSRPPSTTRPSSGDRRPATTCSVVVLPHPLGPSKVRNSPSRTSKSTGPTPRVAPYRLTTPWSSRIAFAIVCGVKRRPHSAAEHFLVPAVADLVAVGEHRHVIEGALDLAERRDLLVGERELLEVGRQVAHRLDVGRRVPGQTREGDLLVRLEGGVHELLGQLDALLRPAGDDRRVPDEAEPALLRHHELDGRPRRRRLLGAGADVRAKPDLLGDQALLRVLDVVDGDGLVLLVELLQLRD